MIGTRVCEVLGIHPTRSVGPARAAEAVLQDRRRALPEHHTEGDRI